MSHLQCGWCLGWHDFGYVTSMYTGILQCNPSIVFILFTSFITFIFLFNLRIFKVHGGGLSIAGHGLQHFYNWTLKAIGSSLTFHAFCDTEHPCMMQRENYTMKKNPNKQQNQALHIIKYSICISKHVLIFNMPLKIVSLKPYC